VNRFLISAAHRSSGKTVVSAGLAAALTRRGHKVSTFKKGPDYIDPMWLGLACGQPCWNLDFFTMGSDEIRECFVRQSAGADVVLIEGNKGLFDGLDVKGSDSNAALAKLLNIPVVLVIDVTGMTRGIAPLLSGYIAFDPEVQIAGVVLNRVAGPRQEHKLRAAIDRYTDLTVLGAIPRSEELHIEERHLGLVTSAEHDQADIWLGSVAKTVDAAVDIEALLGLTDGFTGEVFVKPVEKKQTVDLRIAIARDKAFGFYYPDDLAAFSRAGAELVPFDTLNDQQLPDVDGLFIGGGFPEKFMDQLSANKRMLESVRKFIEEGGPAYAECGGLMYLCRSMRLSDAVVELVGVIPADVVMEDRPVGRGYMVCTSTAAHPWPNVARAAPRSYRFHEFHYSRLMNLSDSSETVFEVNRGYGIDGKLDGYVCHNLLATYAHQRQVCDNPWVDQFVEFVRGCH
jgi:cobyrinic acid a,c-diamide synthase